MKSDICPHLRKFTAVHERLRRHEGFAAGTIDRFDRRRLLSRLWGFRHAFDGAIHTFFETAQAR
jgi:hypothetical protein